MFREIVVAGVLIVSITAVMAEPRQGRRMLEQADTNKDGMIDRDELAASRAAQFARLDRNSDGFIDDTDSPKRDGKGHAGERAAALREQLDTNTDGKISKEEFLNGRSPFFDQADTDRDGVLSAKELEAAKAAVKARISERRSQRSTP